jgi:hypothetical protein
MIDSAAVLRKLGGPLEIEQLQVEGPRDDGVLVRPGPPPCVIPTIDFWESGLAGAVLLGHRRGADRDPDTRPQPSARDLETPPYKRP